MQRPKTLSAPIMRGTATIVAVGLLTGCLRPWAEPAPEIVSKRPQQPVVTAFADNGAAAPVLVPTAATTVAPAKTPVVAPSVAPTITPAVAVQATAGPRVITVTEDDTLYRIAWREDVALQSLVEANGLTEPYIVVPGQKLTVPNLPEYVVQADDTLYAISQCAGVAVGDLARTNGIDAPYIISPGQRLRIPERTNSPACRDGKTEIAAATKPQDKPLHLTAATRPSAKPPVTRAVPKTTTAPVPIASPPSRSAADFLWPVDGKIVSSYGPKQGARQNNGINIAATSGAPVRAAENGVVVYAGNELRGYGNLLLVRHADGWTSAYAHNEELLVDRGAVVKRGQVIAKVGTTGSVNTPQSHFELRKGAKAVDPMKYLSPR